MLLRQVLLSTSFFFLCSLGSLTVYAVSQEECCMKLFNGHFLPLECGNFLGGSVLSFPERMQRRMPPLMCGSVPPAMNRAPMASTPAMMSIPPLMIRPPMWGMPAMMRIPPMWGPRSF